jgi:hypothetical protein
MARLLPCLLIIAGAGPPSRCGRTSSVSKREEVPHFDPDEVDLLADELGAGGTGRSWHRGPLLATHR